MRRSSAAVGGSRPLFAPTEALRNHDNGLVERPHSFDFETTEEAAALGIGYGSTMTTSNAVANFSAPPAQNTIDTGCAGSSFFIKSYLGWSREGSIP